MLGRTPSRAYLATAAVVIGVLAFGPVALRTPMMVPILIGGLTALHVGLRRNADPAAKTPWRCLLWASWLFVAASIVRAAVPASSATPPTPWVLIPDSLVVPAYVLLSLAFAGMLRRRRATEDDPARADAVLVGLAAAILLWTYLIVPSIDLAGLNPLRVANAFFPVIDAVILVLVVQLALSGTARQPAFWMLTAATGVMFVGDLLYTLRAGLLLGIPQHPLDVLFMVTFMLVGAAALHPSMRTLTEPQHIEVRDLGRPRIIMIAMVVVVPIVVSTLQPRTTLLYDVVESSLCGLLVLAVLARVVRSNNSQARAERATRRRATHDALTDLPNRELLAETITGWGERASAERLEISLLFIDLDHFKMVNDHWGHQVGDELLRAVAARLTTQVRGDDLVCRIGGDEFVIALASPSHSALAESLATRVLAELARPVELSVGSVVMSASIGVAKARGGIEALALIRDADTAMYKAKSAGRNAYALFDSSMRDQVRRRVDLEQALRGALANGELSVQFQPIVELSGGALDGFEALMRWTHPELGVVSPLDFIPIAEETGLIVESGAWLLRESARQLTEWTALRPPGAPPLHVSVNVSVRQLRDGALLETVREVLADTGLPARALWLEITESGVMEDVDTALATMNALRGLGVTLCVDDFGTGYSSLSYLHRLPVEIVKIDRSFIAGVGGNGPHEPIVRAVLAMTRAIGQRVVAEGVETAGQRDWLRAQGCDLAQGWLFGRPQPAADHTGLAVSG
jgi:diguanylate cyclase (GGDEF)-like protein